MAVMGFPVVVATNGLGIPVVPDPNGVNATLAQNGLGAPIVIATENGIPMNIDVGPAPGGSPPINVILPNITDTSPLINRQMTSYEGGWRSNTPVTYACRWQSSADGGTTWDDIPGATDVTYTPVFADRTKILRFGVIATNNVGSSDEVFSIPCDNVAPLDFQFHAGIYGAPSGDTGYGLNRMGQLIGDQPIPGYTLVGIYSRVQGYGNIAFSGDCSDVIGNLDIVLSGSVPATWTDQSAFTYSGGYTQCIVGSASAFPQTSTTTASWIERT